MLAVFILVVLATVTVSNSTWAEDSAQQQGEVEPEGGTLPPQRTASSRFGWLFEAILSGGPLGFLTGLSLIGMSIAAVALTIDGALVMRRQVFMPPGLADEVRRQLTAGNIGAADQACQNKPSFLALVMRRGMAEAESGWPAIEKRMEDTLAAHAARVARKIDYLALIAQLAPMVGLFGTIMGIFTAFSAMTEAETMASQTAGGMTQAIVSTGFGLLIAIPAWAATVILRLRAEHLTAETAELAEVAVSPLKQVRVVRTASTPPPSGGIR